MEQGPFNKPESVAMKKEQWSNYEVKQGQAFCLPTRACPMLDAISQGLLA